MTIEEKIYKSFRERDEVLLGYWSETMKKLRQKKVQSMKRSSFAKEGKEGNVGNET